METIAKFVAPSAEKYATMHPSHETHRYSMKNHQFYFVEITDTFGGEANYSWVRRYKVEAKTFLGAVQKVSRDTGTSWHKTMDCGDFMRYDSKIGATCFFIELYDPQNHDNLQTEEI